MPHCILFGTQGCHLCELAEALLHSGNIPFEKQDIAHQDDYYALYRDIIPVLLRTDTQLQISWPFDREQLEQFLL